MLPVPRGTKPQNTRQANINEHKTSKSVWDFPTRAFHWALALAVLVSFISVQLDKMEVHFTSGAVVLFLLLFRLMWGLWGPATARFLQFAPTPKRIKAWRAKAEIGHSPLGALSVFAMLGVLGAQATTGLFIDDEIYLTGPLRDYVSSSTAYTATKFHARISDLILALVALHVAAILFYSVVKKSDLLKTFVTGRAPNAEKGIVTRPLALVAATICIAAAPVIWIFS